MVGDRMLKICKSCGKAFETNKSNALYCKGPHYRPCPICGKSVQMIDNDFSRPPRCCSNDCTKQLRKQKFKHRKCEICGEEFLPSSGVQKVCNKKHYRNCVICGKPILWKHLNDTKVTCSQECLTIHMRQHYQEKYGVSHPMMLSEVKVKFKNTMKERYGVESPLQSKYIMSKNQHTDVQRYGTPFACNLLQCKESEKNYEVISNVNRKFANKLSDNGIHCKLEFRLNNFRYDICIPENRTLIEIDPTFTHTSILTHLRKEGLDKYYHVNKTATAIQNGYKCIHIFDWDDWNVIINMFTPKKKIYARNCRILKLNEFTTDEFLIKYHLQGTCRGQTLSLGLLYENELVEIMTFGKPRYSTKHDVELLRLCSRSDVSVIGGASKLFQYAVDLYDLHDIISYCDAAKFDGNVYKQLEMKKIRTTPPQEIWSKDNRKVTANLLRQRGYDQLFHTNYGKGLSNEQLMLDNEWLPIYDCGQYVFEYR